MGRHYYNRSKNYHRVGKALGLSRNERQILVGIFQLIRFISILTIEIFKGLYKAFAHIQKLVINYHRAYSNGYDLNILLDKVHKLTPRQFEILMAELFKCQGYDSVKLTQYVHDYGRDIILKRKTKNGTETIYVECKYYSPNNVIGRDICFKLLGSMQMFNADKGIVCSTGKFHKNSIEVANTVNNLELMNIDDIKRMIFKLNAEQIQRVMFQLDNVS